MYDFLLVTNSNFDVSATVFEILTLKARKSPNFLTPEEIMPLAFFVLTQYQRVTDGRTDRHVASNVQTKTSLAVARMFRDKIAASQVVRIPEASSMFSVLHSQAYVYRWLQLATCKTVTRYKAYV